MITLTGVHLVKKPGCSITHGIYLIINNCGQSFLSGKPTKNVVL